MFWNLALNNAKLNQQVKNKILYLFILVHFRPDSDLETIKHDGNSSSFKITSKVDFWTNRNQKEIRKNVARSEAFEYRDKWLWDVAVNRKMTNVEFVIGEESFGVHRSLLSVRSPVLAALFTIRMKKADTGQGCIEDVDPITFGIFLKFLYTGTLGTSAIDKELFRMAENYQVETLMVCCPYTETIGVDDIFSRRSYSSLVQMLSLI